MQDMKVNGEKYRDSSLELFRIIVMLMIIAHHYVTNSGILKEITQQNVLEGNSIFALMFGFGGKTGINCFVLITGFFMCKSSINLKKYLKLLFEMVFYRFGCFLLFLAVGYTDFSFKIFRKAIFPYWNIGDSFGGSYLVFFLFIPFLNLFIKNLTEWSHIILICVGVLFNTILPTFFGTNPMSTYVGWFMLLYFIAAYFRVYAKPVFENKKIWGCVLVLSLMLSYASIYIKAIIFYQTGVARFYFFVADVHKILALTTSISAFLFFKNLHMKYNPIINKFAASAFGVLLIHANSDTMRKWLWKDMLNNVEAFYGGYFVLHAIVSVIMIYLIAALIDMLRIRIIEKPLLEWYDKRQIEMRFRKWWNAMVSKIVKRNGM